MDSISSTWHLQVDLLWYKFNFLNLSFVLSTDMRGEREKKLRAGEGRSRKVAITFRLCTKKIDGEHRLNNNHRME